MLDWQTQGHLSRGMDVETMWFLLTKKGKSTGKTDKYHYKYKEGFLRKSHFFSLFNSLNNKLSLQNYQKFYSSFLPLTILPPGRQLCNFVQFFSKFVSYLKNTM